MAHVKTAISIEESLFKAADELATEMNTSRSKLFAIAVSEFIQRQKNQQLFEQINAAYDDTPDATERKQQQAMKMKQRQIMEAEQW
jgi:metal-responsive CopG/Arc/MetJ family transcriptional regulator